MIALTGISIRPFFFRIEPLNSLNVVRLAELMVLSVDNIGLLVGLCLICTVAADHLAVTVLLLAGIVVNLLVGLLLMVAEIVVIVCDCNSRAG
jgi:hypothetical protein